MRVNMKHILCVGILLATTSCLKEVDLEHLRPDPKLVLNSVASEGEPLKASLSRTWFYTDDYPNVTIEDARLNLYVNDRLIGEMNWMVEENEYYSIGNYVSSYIPVAGDKIRIEAEKEGFREVMAEDVIPGKPTLLKLVAESFRDVNQYNSSEMHRYKVTFRDDPHANNCYLISFSIGRPTYEHEYHQDSVPTFTGEYYWGNEYIDYTSDPVFSDKISILDKVMGNDWLSGSGGRPFSDELFNGKEYTMTLDSNSGTYTYWPYEEERLPDSIRVYLYAISEPYYKYLSAVASLSEGSLNNDLADIGLAEPVRVYSNIKGGLGIFGTACVDSLTAITPLLSRYLPDNDPIYLQGRPHCAPPHPCRQVPMPLKQGYNPVVRPASSNADRPIAIHTR